MLSQTDTWSENSGFSWSPTLEFPPGFPEDSQAPVIAAEARARAVLKDALSSRGWRSAGGGTRYLDWDLVKADVLTYLVAVVGMFAQQACAAVEAQRLAVTRLDWALETFVENAMHHAYWRLDLEKIRRTWGDDPDRLRAEMRPRLMAGDWHNVYLAEVPRIVDALAAAGTRTGKVASKAETRKSVVEPLLKGKGWTPAAWAHRAGLDPSVAYGYLKAESDPTRQSRKLLAEALGLKERDLPV